MQRGGQPRCETRPPLAAVCHIQATPEGQSTGDRMEGKKQPESTRLTEKRVCSYSSARWYHIRTCDLRLWIWMKMVCKSKGHELELPKGCLNILLNFTLREMPLKKYQFDRKLSSNIWMLWLFIQCCHQVKLLLWISVIFDHLPSISVITEVRSLHRAQRMLKECTTLS